eukprot:TRINITY_DN2810_c1_g1::TRINITY_DN2810_c1_g1_i2::g.5298::m.5298 TRINITY_DN2810_c1_g1::TRINITY_DN2810_c1_g1_i2::g.5298  ORF type:complete len:318 (+),score=19.16,DUF2854/PF11016.3/1.6e+03,DUF2854/PF11016.3/1.2e+02,DUF2854/PF11016.3/8.9,DUF1631/PF07793.6/3.7 TRINITY_DN2810_c1_g1_i2:528-1481(+)
MQRSWERRFEQSRNTSNFIFLASHRIRYLADPAFFFLSPLLSHSRLMFEELCKDNDRPTEQQEAQLRKARDQLRFECLDRYYHESANEPSKRAIYDILAAIAVKKDSECNPDDVDAVFSIAAKDYLANLNESEIHLTREHKKSEPKPAKSTQEETKIARPLRSPRQPPESNRDEQPKPKRAKTTGSKTTAARSKESESTDATTHSTVVSPASYVEDHVIAALQELASGSRSHAEAPTQQHQNPCLAALRCVRVCLETVIKYEDAKPEHQLGWLEACRDDINRKKYGEEVSIEAADELEHLIETIKHFCLESGRLSHG